jgi:RNA-binding protein NOB1
MNALHADEDDDNRYQYLVVDSGPIIRRSGGGAALWRRARTCYTVPAVLDEIRDAKARQHLTELGIDLQIRSASKEGIHAMMAFSRQTGDFPSLSSVDLQVLGLLYDLERDACGGDMSHVRTTPKRRLGLGRMQTLGPAKNTAGASSTTSTVIEAKDYIVENEVEQDLVKNAAVSSVQNDDNHSSGDDLRDPQSEHAKKILFLSETTAVVPNPTVPSSTNRISWATVAQPHSATVAPIQSTRISFTHLEISNDDDDSSSDHGGQFSDAEDEHPLDDTVSDPRDDSELRNTTQGELLSDFPSLAASGLSPSREDALAVGYETMNDDNEELRQQEEAEERKRRSLQPISKSGKLYNSFTKYQHLMKPAPAASKTRPSASTTLVTSVVSAVKEGDEADEIGNYNPHASRIMGGTNWAGQGDDVEDDGEGWISNKSEISIMKAAGVLDPTRNPKDLGATPAKPGLGPLTCHRAACATTDFAMQNVILQMNLELLSVDGMKVRKLKNWVTRCGACYTVYTSSDHTGPLGKRLFCEKCGSDLMQRIAASVDGKTGRLRLHLSKNYQHNLRGTKFSLPKPGSGNRFHGDLLLREDQLLMGAWNQKVKMISGGKARDSAQSIFGRDIAANVGCHAKAVSVDDIRVGFGRQNPNAAKGRERRGKKKKTADKACGLRRY